MWTYLALDKGKTDSPEFLVDFRLEDDGICAASTSVILRWLHYGNQWSNESIKCCDVCWRQRQFIYGFWTLHLSLMNFVFSEILGERKIKHFNWNFNDVLSLFIRLFARTWIRQSVLHFSVGTTKCVVAKWQIEEKFYDCQSYNLAIKSFSKHTPQSHTNWKVFQINFSLKVKMHTPKAENDVKNNFKSAASLFNFLVEFHLISRSVIWRDNFAFTDDNHLVLCSRTQFTITTHILQDVCFHRKLSLECIRLLSTIAFSFSFKSDRTDWNVELLIARTSRGKRRTMQKLLLYAKLQRREKFFHRLFDFFFLSAFVLFFFHFFVYVKFNIVLIASQSGSHSCVNESKCSYQHCSN